MQKIKTAEESPTNKPLVIPVFIPNAGCPHRCIFCNQTAVSGHDFELPGTDTLHDQIERFLAHHVKRRRHTEIAFYGGNFLGLEPSAIRQLLEGAYHYIKSGIAEGLRFSTRPDTITPERMALLNDYPVSTVEVGAQSMSDKILKCSKRGHSTSDTARAINLLKDAGYQTGIQLMVGLPNETRDDIEITSRSTAALTPDFARIYPTLVLAGSPLANSYRQGRFTPVDLDEAIWRAKNLYSRFTEAGIHVIRMGLQASEELSLPSHVLAGPYHPAFGELVISSMFLDAVTNALKDTGLQKKMLELRVHPRCESKLRGLRNQNLKFIQSQYALDSLTVVPDIRMGEQELCVNDLNVSIIKPIASDRDIKV